MRLILLINHDHELPRATPIETALHVVLRPVCVKIEIHHGYFEVTNVLAASIWELIICTSFTSYPRLWPPHFPVRSVYLLKYSGRQIEGFFIILNKPTYMIVRYTSYIIIKFTDWEPILQNFLDMVIQLNTWT